MKSKNYICDLNTNLHVVKIDPLLWDILNSVQKENMAQNIASYYSFNSEFHDIFIDIYNFQSGKKLAKYDPFGFKVY